MYVLRISNSSFSLPFFLPPSILLQSPNPQIREKMNQIYLEDETIDAGVMDSLTVTMDNFRVSYRHSFVLMEEQESMR